MLARFRRRANGKWETPADSLPQSNYMLMREVAGVDSDIFYEWVRSFILETSFLHARGKKMLLIFDGYGSHWTYRVLRLFKDNGIVIVSLPSHTSHVLQPLDVGVFRPWKNAFRSALNNRTVVVQLSTRNYIYTICELL